MRRLHSTRAPASSRPPPPPRAHQRMRLRPRRSFASAGSGRALGFGAPAAPAPRGQSIARSGFQVRCGAPAACAPARRGTAGACAPPALLQPRRGSHGRHMAAAAQGAGHMAVTWRRRPGRASSCPWRPPPRRMRSMHSTRAGALLGMRPHCQGSVWPRPGEGASAALKPQTPAARGLCRRGQGRAPARRRNPKPPLPGVCVAAARGGRRRGAQPVIAHTLGPRHCRLRAQSPPLGPNAAAQGRCALGYRPRAPMGAPPHEGAEALVLPGKAVVLRGCRVQRRRVRPAPHQRPHEGAEALVLPGKAHSSITRCATRAASAPYRSSAARATALRASR
jgi:hypothetical protein